METDIEWWIRTIPLIKYIKKRNMKGDMNGQHGFVTYKDMITWSGSHGAPFRAIFQ